MWGIFLIQAEFPALAAAESINSQAEPVDFQAERNHGWGIVNQR